MSRRDWVAAGWVAMLVAMMTVAVLAPPVCWADEQQIARVPALPPTALTIPKINATVTATTTTPEPGKEVEVQLSVNAPAWTNLKEVPVELLVNSTTMSPMMRSIPSPKQIAQLQVMVPVNYDGKGTAQVELPLQWDALTAAKKDPEALAKQEGKPVDFMKPVTTYQMALSSPMGGAAAPADLHTVIAMQQTAPANNFPTIKPQSFTYPHFTNSIGKLATPKKAGVKL